MKTKKQTNNYSSPDFNDKFMKSLGFYRDPEYDSSNFNKSLDITYWINLNCCRVITQKKVKMTPPEIIDLISRQVAAQTREEIRQSI
jgi:hypothetical protein